MVIIANMYRVVVEVPVEFHSVIVLQQKVNF